MQMLQNLQPDSIYSDVCGFQKNVFIFIILFPITSAKSNARDLKRVSSCQHITGVDCHVGCSLSDAAKSCSVLARENNHFSFRETEEFKGKGTGV